MKHTLIMGSAALALSACTCTCPENNYDYQRINPSTQYVYQQPQTNEDQGSIQVYRYTKIRYIAPEQKRTIPEIIYYPVYQPTQATYQQNDQDDCCCEQQSMACGC